MSGENEIFSKLNELRKLIDDHSKGRPIAKTDKQRKSKKTIKKEEYSDFSSILSGNEEDLVDSSKTKNKKRSKSHSTAQKTQLKTKTKSVQKNTKTRNSTNKPKTKTPKKVTKKIKIFEEEEENFTENINNDLSIHRDNLHKIFDEYKKLDSIIEASLSPKPVKNRSAKPQSGQEDNKTPEQISNHSSATPSQKKSGSSVLRSESSKHSNKNSKTSNSHSKASQNSQEQHLSTPSFISDFSSEQKNSFEEEEEEIITSNNSNKTPSSENIVVYSNSSQVYVIEQETQTNLSGSQHSNSYGSSKNDSNAQHLLDINIDKQDDEIIEEEEEGDFLSEGNDEEEILEKSSQKEQKNQEKATINSQASKNSSDSGRKNQQNPHEEIIVFKNAQPRSIELNDQDNNNEGSSENLDSEHNILEQPSSNSSSDISIEAINSNSSDDDAGQVIQSPIKTKIVKQPEYLEPIIDSEPETKKQKQPPPQLTIPKSQNLITRKNKSDNYDFMDIEMDLENREDIIEILQTSSSDEDISQPPNRIFSSSATPKSTKTPEYIKPVFSSESESKHTTDTDKEKQENSGSNYLMTDEVEIITNKEIDSLRNKVISNDLLLNISSSEDLSFEESAGSNDGKGLILLQTTDSDDNP